MIDHRSYAHNLIKAWNIQAWTGFEPMQDICDSSTVLYQLSYQATGSWPLCEFVIYP